MSDHSTEIKALSSTFFGNVSRVIGGETFWVWE